MPLPAVVAAIAGKALDSLFGVIDKAVEDKDKAAEIKLALQVKVLDIFQTELATARDIIVAEAQGGSWLQRSWRPITMLIFVGLVVAKWLGYTADGVSEAIELELLSIIKVGLGGYVIGRSTEKAIEKWKA